MTDIINGPGTFKARDGSRVHIIGRSVVDHDLWIGERCHAGNGRTLTTWGDNGTWRNAINGEDDTWDITGPWVEPRKKVEGWVNVYAPSHYGASMHPTQAAADKVAVDGRLACVFVRECDPPVEGERTDKHEPRP